MSDDYPLYKSNLFVVSPVTKRVFMEAGGTYRGYVDITNPLAATSVLHYKVSVMPYGVVDEEYLADFANISDYTAIANWVTILEPEGVLEPNETRRVYYEIKVPEDAIGGGQYCALAIRNVPEDDNMKSGVQIQDVLEITSIVYAQVDGEILRGGEILGNNIPTFSLTNPITTSIYVKNDGNTHQDVTVTLNVHSAFTGEKIDIGGKTSTASEEDDEFGDSYFTELIMPETTRYISYNIEGLPSLGVFRVSQEVSFAGSINNNEQIVFMCPGWFIGAVLLTIACLVISFWGMRRRRRAKKLRG